MARHTPGPWEVTSISQQTGDIGIGQRDQRILIAEVTNAASFGEMVAGAINRGVEGSNVLRSDDATTQWANARLIAAAPDLASAAEAFCAPYAEVTDAQLAYCAKGQGGGVSINISVETAVALIAFRAALAKAGT